MAKQGKYMPHCQWPDCDTLAVVSVRTLHVPWLRLCSRHRDEWRHLHYLRMVEISANRGSARARPYLPGSGMYSVYGVQTVGVRNGAGMVNS